MISRDSLEVSLVCCESTISLSLVFCSYLQPQEQSLLKVFQSLVTIQPQCICFTLEDPTVWVRKCFVSFPLELLFVVCLGAGSTCVEQIGLCRTWSSMLQCSLQCTLLKVLESIRKYGYHEITHPGQVQSDKIAQFCWMMMVTCLLLSRWCLQWQVTPFCYVATSLPTSGSILAACSLQLHVAVCPF